MNAIRYFREVLEGSAEDSRLHLKARWLLNIAQMTVGAYPGDKYSDVLYENPGFGGRFLTVKLIGVQSNRSAIGARLHLRVIEDGETRSIYRHINSGGSFGANPLRQTLGLGNADKIETLEVFWPTSGRTQTFRDLPINQFIQIVEGEERYTKFVIRNP